MAEDSTNQPTSEQGQQAQFAIQKIYVKDLSFETPNSPHIFNQAQEWKPELNLQLSNENQRIADNIHEVVLSLTVTAKLGDQTAFLAEVHQAGIFMLNGYNDESMGSLLGSYCPNILFPFAREVVADLVTKGGFPPLLLAPINFDALYAQQQQQRQSAEAAEVRH
ncbi:protein-export chaperone SecB [Nitrosococcus watsonii]|uniref:Protein-export protein SecB n=1 Tax=Nitrosococcus watsoni (strain C-113) TaxID=105559 RepID=D8K828_NITWC|nr:protein-export chaperone SecB [Nitrosococcus watsonii]ADJ27023.1 protein-export protein SecB [Nitrosococcus watsonii C-113]